MSESLTYTPPEAKANTHLLLAGKSAVVIGGSRGIGKAIAREFVDQGVAELAVVSRKVRSARDIMRYAKEHGVEATHIQADVSKRRGVERIIDTLVNRGASLDVVVNCVSVRNDGPIGTYDWRETREVLETNLLAPMMVVNGIVGERLYKEGSTVIINIGSIVGEIVGNAGQPRYGATKAGLRGFTRSAAVELGNSIGVRVVEVDPGFVDTEFVADVTGDPKGLKMLQDATPLKRIGQPEDIAPLVAFLASDGARFITGSSHIVDGGLYGGASSLYPLQRAKWEWHDRRTRQSFAAFQRQQSQEGAK